MLANYEAMVVFMYANGAIKCVWDGDISRKSHNAPSVEEKFHGPFNRTTKLKMQKIVKTCVFHSLDQVNSVFLN